MEAGTGRSGRAGSVRRFGPKQCAMRGRNSLHYVDRSTRSRSSVPRVAGIVPVAGALALLGGASTPGDPVAGPAALEPYGPGHVFSTVEAAVVDAMAFSLTDARRTSQRGRMYGGSIKTRWDRKSVDIADPRHRSLCFLTPKLVAKACHGKASALPTQEIARLDRVSEGLRVEMIASTVTAP